MAGEGESIAAAVSKKRKQQRYLPQKKSVKKKGSSPLRPGVEGFFITCDGGREHQASREAISVIDKFYEELVNKDNDDANNITKCPVGRLNKITKFSDSDDDDDDHNNDDESKAKKQRADDDDDDTLVSHNKKPIDKLIEDELKQLGDPTKRRFVSLDSGCNGVVFLQMLKREEDPGPTEIVQKMMTSSASTKKHISRFLLRVLPVELSCYASEEEISRAIRPLLAQYFPEETQNPLKFAVLFESRANTGIDRMAIINSVAKAVCGPHKVDLNNPDKTIILQVVKTVCLIGVVARYKELSKYNLRQLTSSQA